MFCDFYTFYSFKSFKHYSMILFYKPSGSQHIQKVSTLAIKFHIKLRLIFVKHFPWNFQHF